MFELNKDTINSKIKEYMNVYQNLYAHIVENSENNSVYNDYIFNLNDSGDIAMSLHTHSGDNKLHKHDFFELIYVYSGYCTQIIDDKEMILKEGQLCFVNTKATHSIKTHGNDNIIFNFMFKKSFFSRHFLNLITNNNDLSSFLVNYLFDNNSRQSYLLFNTLNTKSAQTILFNIINEFIKEDLGFRSIIESLYVILFIEIARNNENSINNMIANPKRYVNINEIISYIEDNYAHTSLEKTARHFHYHPAYLSKAIKKSTNKTYSKILREIRFREAKFFLTETNMTINQITKTIGYNQLSQFYTAFKKEFNMTPSKYRTTHKGKK